MRLTLHGIYSTFGNQFKKDVLHIMQYLKWTGISVVSVSIVIFTLIFTTKQITINNINSTAQALQESEHSCNYDLVQQGYKIIDPMLFAAVTMQKGFFIHDATVDLDKWEYSPIPNANPMSNKQYKFDFEHKNFTLNNLCTAKQNTSLTNKVLYGKVRKDNSIIIDKRNRTVITESLKFKTIGGFPNISIKINELRSNDINIIKACEASSHKGDIKAYRATLLNDISNCDIGSAINALLEMKNKSSQEMLLLGDLYLTDSSTGTRDTASANKWFLRASAIGTPKTQYQAAKRLNDDMPSTAKYIFTLSAINGFELSAYQLSKTSKNNNQSYFWSLNRYFLCLQENKICD